LRTCPVIILVLLESGLELESGVKYYTSGDEISMQNGYFSLDLDLTTVDLD